MTGKSVGRWAFITLNEDEEDKQQLSKILALLRRYESVTRVSKVDTTLVFKEKRGCLSLEQVLSGLVTAEYLTLMLRLWENTPVSVVVVESKDPLRAIGDALEGLKPSPIPDTVWFADDVGANKEKVMDRIIHWFQSV
jgi:hypothetical protein